jgi:threonine dehydrogenase-like Zn-dependent dehydrogenase
METALNALWDARPSAGSRVVVIGAGVVGLLTAYLCASHADADVVVHDIDPGRAEVSASLGLTFSAEPPAESNADLVVHASGSEPGLRTALAAAGMEATVLELSWYGSRSVSLPLGEAFHARRLTLKSSQVGRIPPHMRDHWDHRGRLERALELLLDERLDALVSGESAFDELPSVLADLSRDGRGVLCQRIRYP